MYTYWKILWAIFVVIVKNFILLPPPKSNGVPENMSFKISIIFQRVILKTNKKVK